MSFVAGKGESVKKMARRPGRKGHIFARCETKRGGGRAARPPEAPERSSSWTVSGVREGSIHQSLISPKRNFRCRWKFEIIEGGGGSHKRSKDGKEKPRAKCSRGETIGKKVDLLENVPSIGKGGGVNSLPPVPSLYTPKKGRGRGGKKQWNHTHKIREGKIILGTVWYDFSIKGTGVGG